MDDFYFLVGSINKPGDWFHPSGKGLSVLSLNRQSGSFRLIADYPSIENVIWLAHAPFGFLAASEQYLQNGKIYSFTIDQNEHCTNNGGTSESNGGAICHIEIVEAYSLVIATSFFGGLSLHTYDKTGMLSPAYQTLNYLGKGSKPMQDKSHPHQATLAPDKKHVLVCDLGNDTVWKHRIYIQNGLACLEKGEPLTSSIGSGPRHLVFHPILPIFYLLGQLDGSVTTYQYSAQCSKRSQRSQQICFKETQFILPPPFSGEMSAAAIKIHPSQKTIYISERQTNTIAVFEIKEDGTLRRNCYFSCGGNAPRDFLFSAMGDWLIVLNHDSDNMVSFSVNPVTGLPDTTIVGTFAFGCPVCALPLNNTTKQD